MHRGGAHRTASATPLPCCHSSRQQSERVRMLVRCLKGCTLPHPHPCGHVLRDQVLGTRCWGPSGCSSHLVCRYQSGRVLGYVLYCLAIHLRSRCGDALRHCAAAQARPESQAGCRPGCSFCRRLPTQTLTQSLTQTLPAPRNAARLAVRRPRGRASTLKIRPDYSGARCARLHGSSWHGSRSLAERAQNWEW